MSGLVEENVVASLDSAVYRKVVAPPQQPVLAESPGAEGLSGFELEVAAPRLFATFCSTCLQGFMYSLNKGDTSHKSCCKDSMVS